MTMRRTGLLFNIDHTHATSLGTPWVNVGFHVKRTTTLFDPIIVVVFICCCGDGDGDGDGDGIDIMFRW